MKNEGKKEIKYFSMFTGVGGFELGFKRANNDKFNTETQNNYERNKPNTSKCNGNGGRSCSNDSKPLPKIEQDRERGNRTSNEQGTRIRTGSISTLFTPIGFSEIDKYASELLKNKWPNIKNYGDATKIIPEELPDFNLLVGGCSCQAFSIAGKRKGFEDTRGTLFYDIARILKVKRPKYILLENVKGLLSHDRGRTFGTILTTLSELGYVIQWMVLNSKFFGVPQNRERVFIIGSLRGEPIPEILPLGESSNFPIKELQVIRNSSYDTDRLYGTDGVARTMRANAGGKGAQTGLYAISRGRSDDLWKESDVSPSLRLKDKDNVRAVITPNRTNMRQNGRRFKEDGEPSFTLTGQDVHGVSDGTKIRRLTPKECERLQGFPDGWTEGFSDTQRYKMMGNAVTVPVIKAIIESMFK